MSSDIISLLNLESHQRNKLFIFATKDTSSDLNFFFSDILSFYLKQNYSIIIANLAQSYSHFTHLLLKCGINLRMLRDQEKIAIVDVMTEAGSIINQTESETSNSFLCLISDGDSSQCLKPLFESIKKAVEKISLSKPKGFIIFIDEINILTSLGVSLKAIQLFIQHLFCTELADVPVNFLFGSFLDDCDVGNGKVVTYLNKFADINVQVEGLKTGYSKDTHGKITLGIKNKSECSSEQQTLFFKVGDKGAKLLTLGFQKISNLPEDIFTDMRIIYFNFEGNLLKSIPEKALMKLFVVYLLRGNPIVCNCDMKWLTTPGKVIRLLFDGECAEPGSFKGKQLNSLTQSDFDFCL